MSDYELAFNAMTEQKKKAGQKFFGIVVLTTDEYYAVLEALDAKIKDNNGWISVDERLPPLGLKNIVCCQTKTGHRSINLAWFDGQSWHGTGSMAGVTHWMPLPELPEVIK